MRKSKLVKFGVFFHQKINKFGVFVLLNMQALIHIIMLSCVLNLLFVFDVPTNFRTLPDIQHSKL